MCFNEANRQLYLKKDLISVIFQTILHYVLPMSKLLIFSFCFALANQLLAQQRPEAEIFLLECSKKGQQLSFTKEAVNLTNRKGYDNQPHFVDNQTILFVSDEGTPDTNVWQYDLKTGQKKQLTYTTESEFSPTLMPKKNGFSAVRIDNDGKQRLHAFDLQGHHQQVLLDSTLDIGYHTWVSDTLLSLFFVGNPQRLYLQGVKGFKQKLLDSPGRGMKYLKSQNSLYFVSKKAPKQWMLMRYDFTNNETTECCLMPEGVEDLAVVMFAKKVEKLICPAKGVIQIFDEKAKQFVPYLDTKISQGSITRIAVSPDGTKIAVVITL